MSEQPAIREMIVVKITDAIEKLADKIDHKDFAPNLIDALAICLVATLHANSKDNIACKELFLRRVSDKMVHILLRINDEYGETSEKSDEDAEGSDRPTQE